MTCPFCDIDPQRVFLSEANILCIWDAFPVADGHALVIPRRHFGDWFDATEDERRQLMRAITDVRRAIEDRFQPDGFNIGINVGAAAGQTVDHLHIHVIPRYRGDVRDPRGGVRHVIPDKGNYLRLQDEVRDEAHGYQKDLIRRDIYGTGLAPFIDGLATDLADASHVDIAVAFITTSGLVRLERYLVDLLDAGGKLRLLTGDYLNVTEPRALLRILDLTEEYSRRDQVEARVFQTDVETGFHPKAFLLHKGYAGTTAYIGSSNLTKHALESGIEWNQRIEASPGDPTISAIAKEFNALWTHAKTKRLTPEWIAQYEKRWKSAYTSPKIVGIDTTIEESPEVPTPHSVQDEALQALRATRESGNQAGLVVLATGLGKTWLSAFDSVDFDRVLFVAHREEILKQALVTYRRIRPDVNMGLYFGGQYDAAAEVLFASVQTLSRANHLQQFAPSRFDYIVIDEFHHAAARTYQTLIDYFEPEFLLGLTATPERSDGGDLLALCGENLVYRCDLVNGINRELLSPFEYFGIPDEVDFSNIPWRSGRFDPEALEHAVATEKRAQNALEQWEKRGQEKALAFCVSKKHADYMADYFRGQGVKAVAVHSGATSAPRSQSLDALQVGKLDVVFAVDMFNEGVDVPEIDTVIMLRPTESKILWLQQFGRGLRKAADKSRLTVIDYIGNHKTFLQVPALLLPGISDHPGEILRALAALKRGELELPAGCSVSYELEAIEILEQLATPSAVGDQVVQWYRTFTDIHGRRPTASEAYHEGYDPKALRRQYGSWLNFVKNEGDLLATEVAGFENHRDFLDVLEVTPMTKSFKIVTLLAMIAAGKFPGEIQINALAEQTIRIAKRTSRLKDDFGGALSDTERLRGLLESNPIEAWTGGKGTGGKKFFTYDQDMFAGIEVDKSDTEAIRTLTRELCDYRLAKYLDRQGPGDVDVEEPVQVSTDLGEPELWRAYMREEIPPLWGLEFRPSKWQQGFVREGKHLFLLVSVDKAGMAAEHQYEDEFLTPTVFKWVSQNRTRRNSDTGKRIAGHREKGYEVHLFVRDKRKTPAGKAAPFHYCGEVEFVEWEHDQPIAVTWRLAQPVPRALMSRFGISS